MTRLPGLAISLTLATTLVSANASTPEPVLMGVKIGMTRAEATTALRKADPQLNVFEAVTVHATGVGLAQMLKSQLRPGEPGYVSALVAAHVKSEKGLADIIGSTCEGRPATATIITVQFDTDLRNPRAVLVDEYSYFCDGKTTSEAALAKALGRVGAAPDTSSGVRLVGQRWLVDTTTQTSTGYSLLQWQTNPRVGTADYLSEAHAESPLGRSFSRVNGFGHPGGGIVIQAILKPKWPSATYAELMETLLWDDNALLDIEKKRSALLTAMDQKGISISMLDKPGVIEGLVSAIAPPPPAHAASGSANNALAQNYTLRMMEGECTLPAGTPINVVGKLAPNEQKSYREPRVFVTLPPDAAAKCPGLNLDSRKLAFPETALTRP